MNVTLWIVLAAIAALFGALALLRLGLLGRVRPGFGWTVAGAATAVAALVLRQPMVLLAAGAMAGYGLWRQRQARSGQRPATPGDRARAAALLQVAETASTAEVRQAFRRAMADAHPDAGGDPERARALIAARDLLLDRNR